VARQQATSVVAAPLELVEDRLREVARWPEFLIGLEAVEPTGFERYRFTVTEGGRRRVIPVCVVPHPAEHRISWKALEGARYIGDLRLHAVDDRHTRVDLTMIVDPAGFAAGFREIVGERHQTVVLDLQRLDAFLAAKQPSD
jgi:uncharacterized membrane protein